MEAVIKPLGKPRRRTIDWIEAFQLSGLNDDQGMYVMLGVDARRGRATFSIRYRRRKPGSKVLTNGKPEINLHPYQVDILLDGLVRLKETALARGLRGFGEE